MATRRSPSRFPSRNRSSCRMAARSGAAAGPSVCSGEEASARARVGRRWRSCASARREARSAPS
eukprot:6134607-Pyramimonas_sp.AAC.1